MVDHHCLLFVLLILVELLTITVYCLFCWYWWNCWPSLFIVCFVDIGGIIDHHCLLFVLLILVELLTITVYCLFCWYWWNCWPSLFIVCFVVIAGIVDHHCLSFLCIQFPLNVRIRTLVLYFVNNNKKYLTTLCETCWGLVALSTRCVVKDYCICEHPDIVKEYINMQVK
jgi:hypothetical protein